MQTGTVSTKWAIEHVAYIHIQGGSKTVPHLFHSYGVKNIIICDKTVVLLAFKVIMKIVYNQIVLML